VPTWTVGSVEITRVDDPDFELLLPQDEAGQAALRAADWLKPSFVTDDWSLRIGSSATIVASGGVVALVDPFLAFDEPDQLGARLTALRDVGLEADDVDLVVYSHIDHLGVGFLHDGSPTFGRARYLVPREELQSIDAGTHAQAAQMGGLIEQWRSGRIEATDGTEEIGPGLRLEDAPGHNPGHHVLWAEDGDDSAVVIGHLFLHPAQIARPQVDNGDLDPAVLEATRRSLLARCVEQDALVIGPLFAAPGAGRVRPDQESWRLAAA
jgi:glyoxylase-like metal-dependent hydrolase (beta-lactamase superfamily II)